MKKRSIKTNYLLNLIRIAFSAIVGIVTMPYINAALGPRSLGKVEYIYTVINYFILFSALGIPLYGIRTIARVRDDVRQRSKATLELLIILTVTSIISYSLLFGIIYQLDYFSSYREIIMLMSTMIFLTNMGADWYFQGMENQLYITVRYILVRIVTLFLIFLGIKGPEDDLIYAASIVLMICGSNIFNIFYLFKTLSFSELNWKSLEIRKHIKPILTIFVATVAVNIYLQLDILLIGSLKDDRYVGYYTVANKLLRLVISFITIIGTVTLPRLSALYIDDREEYKAYLKKTFNLIVIVSIPATIMFLVFAPSVIDLMGGSQYEAAVFTTQILSPLCVIVGLAYFIGFLVLYTQHREKVYTMATVISALFSISVNLFAITWFYHNGAAVVAVLSELLAIVVMLFLAKREMRELQLINRNFFKIMVASALTLGISILVGYAVSFSTALSIGQVLPLFVPFVAIVVILNMLKEDTTLWLISQARVYLRKN